MKYKNKTATDIKEALQPQEGEVVFTKNVNSAFIGTELESYLREQQVKSVIMTGFSTQHCVSTTTRMSGNLGFDTYVVSDAIAAFEITDHKGTPHSPDAVQEVELATLHKEFATILTIEEILSQLESL